MGLRASIPSQALAEVCRQYGCLQRCPRNRIGQGPRGVFGGFGRPSPLGLGYTLGMGAAKAVRLLSLKECLALEQGATSRPIGRGTDSRTLWAS
jgi:hypothetical protein